MSASAPSSASRVRPPCSFPALVTGGTGFLGAKLVERLRALGRPVTVLARSPAPALEARGVRLVRASIEDAPAVAAAVAALGANATVFHVAARVGVWGHYEDFFRTNVLGTRAVLAACRAHGISRLVHTSTPSVVYNGQDLAGVDESLPLTVDCPSPYPVTKALAEAEVIAANGADGLRTVALRPHLIWGVGDPHLVPRILARAGAGKLRIIGTGFNRVDLTHVDNVVDAHLDAEAALADPASPAAGRAYFITNGEPVPLWNWINSLLLGLGRPPITKRIPLGVASALAAACEAGWRMAGLSGEPAMTRFVAAEMAKDHWFDLSAARRDLGYAPRVRMAEGTRLLIESLRLAALSPAAAPPQRA